MEIELIYRPKWPKTLPNVLSKEEVKAILEAHGNIKHRTMLSLIYACGLSRSELLRLKIQDVDSLHGFLMVKQAKGRKDRMVTLSDKIIALLREYYRYETPVLYLFVGQKPGHPYSEKSLESILKQALVKAKVRKPATPYWLRHSYATHLLESGTDLRYFRNCWDITAAELPRSKPMSVPIASKK